MYGMRDESDPNAHINAYKALNADRRHMFRVVANYMAPWQIKLSTVANFQIGRPYDRYKWVQVPSGHEQTQIIAEPASYDQRYPDQLIWDLSIGKHFNLGRGTNLSVMRSRAGGPASSIPTRILYPASGSCRGGPSCD